MLSKKSPKIKIVAIGGYARAGKDTIADEIGKLAKADGVSFIKKKFADSLRSSLFKAFFDLGLFDVNLYTEDTKEKDKFRGILVSFGEYCRSRDLDVFVKKTIDDINLLTFNNDNHIVAISDMRYQNEYDLIKAYCEKNGFDFYYITVSRIGNKPANEVEAASVKQLMQNQTESDRTVVAANGDLMLLRDFSVDFYSHYLRFTTPQGEGIDNKDKPVKKVKSKNV
jgi:Phosphomevalonate kinase